MLQRRVPMPFQHILALYTTAPYSFACSFSHGDAWEVVPLSLLLQNQLSTTNIEPDHPDQKTVTNHMTAFSASILHTYNPHKGKLCHKFEVTYSSACMHT
jgi:hypothetical protein